MVLPCKTGGINLYLKVAKWANLADNIYVNFKLFSLIIVSFLGLILESFDPIKCGFESSSL